MQHTYLHTLSRKPHWNFCLDWMEMFFICCKCDRMHLFSFIPPVCYICILCKRTHATQVTRCHANKSVNRWFVVAVVSVKSVRDGGRAKKRVKWKREEDVAHSDIHVASTNRLFDRLWWTGIQFTDKMFINRNSVHYQRNEIENYDDGGMHSNIYVRVRVCMSAREDIPNETDRSENRCLRNGDTSTSIDTRRRISASAPIRIGNTKITMRRRCESVYMSLCATAVWHRFIHFAIYRS